MSKNTIETLHDPPQLTRLVVGELPGESEELFPRDWALLLILKIVSLATSWRARSGFRYTTLKIDPAS
jgi:hypothetical protein